MIFFDDKYAFELDMSQKDFIDGLMKMTEIREDINNDIFPNKKYDFLGQINYNDFSIVLNKSSFLQNNFKVTGYISEQGDKIQVKGAIKGYKILLLFVLIFTLFSFSGMISHLFFISGRINLRIFFSILTFIGVTNIYGVIHGLNKYKKQFLEKIMSNR